MEKGKVGSIRILARRHGAVARHRLRASAHLLRPPAPSSGGSDHPRTPNIHGYRSTVGRHNHRIEKAYRFRRISRRIDTTVIDDTSSAFRGPSPARLPGTLFPAATGSVWRFPRRRCTRKRRRRTRARRTGGVSVNPQRPGAARKSGRPRERTDRLTCGTETWEEASTRRVPVRRRARRAGSDFSPWTCPRKPVPVSTSNEEWSPCGARGSRYSR